MSLFYRVYGDGEPLVLLHGNNEDSNYFDRQIPAFSEYYRVITVDTRGHGKSPRGEKPFTFEQFADDLAAVFKKLEIGCASILGFSDGGNLAITFALKYPEKVRSLVLNGANLYPGGLKLLCRISTELTYQTMRLASHFSDKAVKKREMFHLMARQPDISEDKLEKINVPALVLVGTYDLIREEHSKKIAKRLPQGVLKKLPGPHSIARTNSSAYNEAVLDFLKNENAYCRPAAERR